MERVVVPPNVQADADRIAREALAEDGPRDVTSELTVPPQLTGSALIEFRSAGIVAGLPYADAVAEECGLSRIRWDVREGDRLFSQAVIGAMEGSLRAILRAERPLLNLLQRASGIATLTRMYVDAVEGTDARILHTRKTVPGLRLFDVYAVLAGGGSPHRVDLASEVMVKDNHWRALEKTEVPLVDVIRQGRVRGVTRYHIEVENVKQLEMACEAGATRLLIDNQVAEIVRAWTRVARSLAPAIEIEASGGIDLTNVRAYAEAGVDYISVGALTHSPKAADVGLEVVSRN
ncbi:MAG TPA: carboxylating nicotinate-nucleotide diphosphorylase [Gemmatimonadales bacterium]|nr:carboxylating nicotinate-nucleotide diphosphorylase [Gemmatimonadales bacterium]